MARAKLFGASGVADHRWSTTPRRLGGGRFRTPVGAREFMELRHCTACPCAISGGGSGFNGTGLFALRSQPRAVWVAVDSEHPSEPANLWNLGTAPLAPAP